MKITILLTGFMLSAFLYSCNSENSSNKTAKKENEKKFDSTEIKGDAKFAVEAAAGGLMEVELGNIAIANASAQNVKDFGQSMVTDHTKANEELKATAGAENISLPDKPNSSQQKKIENLRQKKGGDFDKAYIDLMVSDHKEDIEEFRKEADNGNDTTLKIWAAGKLPVLAHHLQMAQDIQNGLSR